MRIAERMLNDWLISVKLICVVDGVSEDRNEIYSHASSNPASLLCDLWDLWMFYNF
jgi:hypothetical protein